MDEIEAAEDRSKKRVTTVATYALGAVFVIVAWLAGENIDQFLHSQFVGSMSPATAGAFVKASRLAEFGTAISLAVFFVAFVVSLELKGKFARFYLRVGGLLMVVESFVLWIPVMRMAAAHG